jgi:NitT/TauT family transport system substrate-binding protein/putative hydroxymethylpyrimidine transport system substrate-binding protein
VRATSILAVTLALVSLTGCSSSGDERRPTVVVALDFTPNAIHAPLYTAMRRGYDRQEGIRLRIRTPGSQPDSLKLLVSGRVDIGVLDIHDLGIARERGRDIVGIAALVQRPLAALLARGGVERPRALEGRVVGVSGLPSDPAFVRAVVEHDGGDYSRLREVTIGFNAVGSLLARKVDAVPAFWNAEGVALRRRGVAIREFRVDDFGAPHYPEVVLMTTRAMVRRHRDLLRRTLRAIRRGVEATLADQESAARQIAAVAGGADLGLVRAQLRAVAPILRPPLRLDRAVLEKWADFDARIGILERRPDVGRAFDFTLAP